MKKTEVFLFLFIFLIMSIVYGQQFGTSVGLIIKDSQGPSITFDFINKCVIKDIFKGNLSKSF